MSQFNIYMNNCFTKIEHILYNYILNWGNTFFLLKNALVIFITSCEYNHRLFDSVLNINWVVIERSLVRFNLYFFIVLTVPYLRYEIYIIQLSFDFAF